MDSFIKEEIHRINNEMEQLREQMKMARVRMDMREEYYFKLKTIRDNYRDMIED